MVTSTSLLLLMLFQDGGAVPYQVDDRDRDFFLHPESHWTIRYT